MLKRLYLLGAAAAFALTACAPDAAAPAPEAAPAEELLLPLPEGTTPAITTADLAVRIKTLADDVFEGRGPGTPAGEASAAWIAAEMARLGLQPGGDNGTFFQEVMSTRRIPNWSSPGRMAKTFRSASRTRSSTGPNARTQIR